MASKSKFRHQDVSAVPSGYKVRTVRAGKHEIRVAFPRGAKKHGSGRIVSILHPLTEQNPVCDAASVAEIQGVEVPVAMTNFGSAVQEILELPTETLTANPLGLQARWDAIRAKVAEWLAPKKSLRELKQNARQKKNYTEQVKTSDGQTVFVDVNESGGSWMAEGYPVSGGKIKRVLKPKIAYGHTEADAYDALIDKLERNPSCRATLKAQRNPTKRNLDEIEQATELASEFQGSPAESVREINLPAKVRDDYAHLGWMVQEVIQPPFDATPLDLKKVAAEYWRIYKKNNDSKKAWKEVAEIFDTTLIVLDVDGDEIELTASADGRQLFFIGGRQSEITTQFEAFGADPNHDLVDLGNMIALTYMAKKVQAGDTEETPYAHVFGEEDGTAPRAGFDTLNKRMVLSGGTYHLNEAYRGIIN